jgi:NAD(P)-dependent dehydrogenase (short-subunit alcohol dehydrogenase family)
MKAVLITGGSRGGRATALLCGANGWSLAINYVQRGRAHGRWARSHERGNVAREADTVEMFDAAEKQLGKLDRVVINNAGIVQASLPLAEMSARIQQTLEVKRGWRIPLRARGGATATTRSRPQRRLDCLGVFRCR